MWIHWQLWNGENLHSTTRSKIKKKYMSPGRCLSFTNSLFYRIPGNSHPFCISSHSIQVAWILSFPCQTLPGPSNPSCLCHPALLLLNPLLFSANHPPSPLFFSVLRTHVMKTTGRKVKNNLTQFCPPVPPSVPTSSSWPTQCDVILEASTVGQVC